jgi:hypothetical protein
MRQRLLKLMLAAAMLAPAAVAATPIEVAAFHGHGCTRRTCTYFTSSHRSTRYFYNRNTCAQWRSLSRTYLHGFRTKAALKHHFPSRRQHAPC